MKLVTITITASFPDTVTDDEIHLVATDATIQVQEPEVTHPEHPGEIVALAAPSNVTTDISIIRQ